MKDSMLPEADKSERDRVILSIVIPSHNPEALFCVRIAKLLEEHPEWQVVVVDDGSDRDVRQFLPEATNLTVLRNATAQGAGISRNIGMQAACGDYTVFLDDDDFMDWSVVEQLIRQMDESPAVDMAVSSYQFLRDGKLAPAHWRDQETLQKILRGQSSRIVMLDDNEGLLKVTNFPWNKLYRTRFIQRIGLRFSGTMVQNDVHAHWQSLLAASRILVTDLIQCTQSASASGSRISNTWDGRRLQAFSALRETYLLVQRSQLPRVETVFWAFYHDLIHWMIDSASPGTRIQLMRAHVRFVGVAPRNMVALEGDTEIKHWSLWKMEHKEDTTPAAEEGSEAPMDPVQLEIWLNEISRLKRLSAELRGENDRLHGETNRLRSDVRGRDERIKTLNNEVTEGRKRLERSSANLATAHSEISWLQHNLNSKAARWAFALRDAYRRVFPVREQDQG